MKSENLNFLELSVPLQSCNGTAFYGGGISLFSAGYDAEAFLCNLGIAGSMWKQIAGGIFPLSATCHSAAVKSMVISASHFTEHTL